jgi:L-2-hydroxyglutarate oxidase LhgO
MKRIYKYTLELTDNQIVEVPIGSRILSVKSQNESLVVYILIEYTATTNMRYEFLIHGTGHYADDVANATFIDSVMFKDGSLVFK